MSAADRPPAPETQPPPETQTGSGDEGVGDTAGTEADQVTALAPQGKDSVASAGD